MQESIAMTENKNIWYCIVNPRAGSGKTMSEWIPAERKLEKKGVSYITEYTDHKKHATLLAYNAAEAGFRKFIAVGGDGSLHEVFCGLCRYCEEKGVNPADFHLAVVPIGSGNDWIKSLGVKKDAKRIASLIADNSFQEMDVVAVTLGNGDKCHMANVGGTGFDAQVCKRVNHKKEAGKRGKWIYLSSLMRTIFTLKALNIKVIADGKQIHLGEVYSLAMGNGKYSGSGMCQVPKAEFNDELLDVMIVPKLKLGEIIKEVPRLFNGTVDQSSKILSFKCHQLYVEPLNEHSQDIVEIDGEIEGRLPMRVEMSGHKINVLTSRKNQKKRS